MKINTLNYLKVHNHYTNPLLEKKTLSKVHNPKFSCGQLVAEDCDMATQLTGHKV